MIIILVVTNLVTVLVLGVILFVLIRYIHRPVPYENSEMPVKTGLDAIGFRWTEDDEDDCYTISIPALPIPDDDEEDG